MCELKVKTDFSPGGLGGEVREQHRQHLHCY